MNCPDAPLVSVLTPVYNGEKYLSQCIDSVLAQTYSNWEYIIVDNCSDDRSLEIAQGYAKNDPRIRIHKNKEYVRVIPNHNIAFKQISPASKYCKIAHADDWLFPDCVRQMVNLAEANPSVAIVGAYGLRETRIAWDGLPYPSTLVTGREICRRTLLSDLDVFGTGNSILIRSDAIRGRQQFYNESNLHADKESCFEVLQNYDFGFVHQVLTFRRLHIEAVTADARRLNTYPLGNLVILTKYGRKYLNDGEYEKCLRQHLIHYYAFLGQSMLHRQDKQFWKYHKNGLRALGYSPNRAKLLGALFLEAMSVLLNPRKTLERIARRIVNVIKREAARSS